MIHIRPYQILAIEDGFPEEIRFFMPQAQGMGSVSTIESILLLKLMRIVKPKYLFEFGTYKGFTTRLLLENIPEGDTEGERIYTLDLPDIANVDFQAFDRDIALESIASQRRYMSSPKKRLVKQILQDSMRFDPHEVGSKFQYVFVDANHELNYVRRDTENAFKMLSGQPCCVIWHDYGSPDFPELTAYLNDLSKEKKLYHIGDTMLVVMLNGVDIAPARR